MKLFDNSRTAGLALMSVGTVSILLAVFVIYYILMAEEIEYPMLLGYSATLIAGIIEFIDGFLIFRTHHGRMAVIEEYLMISGIIILIDFIGDLVSGMMEGEDITSNLVPVAISMLSLVIMIVMVLSIRRNKKNSYDKIIWAVCLLMYVLMMLIALREFIGFPHEYWEFFLVGFFNFLCLFCVYYFVIVSLLSRDIREEFGLIKSSDL